MRPLTAALLIAGSFLIVAVAYLFLSDEIARQLVDDVDQYQFIQSTKGFAFMTLASLGIFWLSHRFLKQIERQEIERRNDREALLLMERRVFAGTLATSIVHDAKNLVGAVRSNLQYIDHTLESTEEVDEALFDSFEAVDELLSLNERLRRTAHAQLDEETVEADLGAVVRTAVSLIETHELLRNCQIDIDDGSQTDARVYPSLITHAVINLVLNAAGAVSDGGTIRVGIEHDDDSTLAIVVEDDGPGIPKERREEVLEPFSTNAKTSLGMGLFSVAYCATHHDGQVTIERSEGLGGACVRLELPGERTL